jgi:hypothetical protein
MPKYGAPQSQTSRIFSFVTRSTQIQVSERGGVTDPSADAPSSVLPHLEEAGLGVTEPIALLGKGVDVDPVRDPILREPAAGLAEITHKIRGEEAGIVPLGIPAQADVAMLAQHRVEIDHEQVDDLPGGIPARAGRGRLGGAPRRT